MKPRGTLHVVSGEEAPARGSRGGGDVGLLLFLLLIASIPLGGSLAGGRFGDRTVGFAAVMSILCLREIARELLGRRRPRS